MREIKILWPTARPAVAVPTLEHWLREAADPSRVSVMFGVNTQAIANDLISRLFHSQAKPFLPRIQTLVMADPNRRGPVYPTCALAKAVQGSDSDIVVLCSDDFYAPPYWDSWLETQIPAGWVGGIVVKDGIQAPDGRACTIPIMSYSALLKMNRLIYPPQYDWLYSDNECFENLAALGMLKESRGPNDPVFQHRHWAVGHRLRDTVDEFSQTRSDSDRALFNTRMKMTVEERISTVYVPPSAPVSVPAPVTASAVPAAPAIPDSQPSLSILICHLESRAILLNRLLGRLNPQAHVWGSKVEVLVDADEKAVTVGTKRNRMLEKAKHDYVCFIDDDDLISHDYVAKIMAALVTRPDCVGLEGIYTRDGLDPRVFKHSLEFKSWYEADGVYFRNPNHLNPIRRDLALAAKFPDMARGEDHAYSQRVQPLLKTEAYISGPIYHYLSGDSSRVPQGV